MENGGGSELENKIAVEGAENRRQSRGRIEK